MIQRIHLNPAIEDCFPSHILFSPWQSQCNAIYASFNGTRWGVWYPNVDIKYSITAWVECCPLLVVHWRCSGASLARCRGGEVARWRCVWVMVGVAAPLSPGNSFLFQWSDEDDDGVMRRPSTLIIRDRYWVWIRYILHTQYTHCNIMYYNFNSFQVCFVLDCLLVLIWIHGACS